MYEGIPSDNWPNGNQIAIPQFRLVSIDANGNLVLTTNLGNFVGAMQFPMAATDKMGTVYRIRPHDRATLIAAGSIRQNRLLECTAGGMVQEAASPAGGVTSFASLNSANAGEWINVLYLDANDGLILTGQIHGP
jgi:hypothetical protein